MRRVVLSALVLVAVSAPATAGAEAVRPLGALAPLGDDRLSNERSVTRWAHAAQLRGVRRRPRTSARPFAQLRLLTEDHRPEVYLVLRSRVRAGQTWLEIRVPGRPNGRTGWVLREGLGRLRTVQTSLVVDRRTLRATLRRRGRIIWSSPVGVGAPGTPTPHGRFWIRERLRGQGGIYGPWAFGTAAYSRLSEWPRGGVIGIHGTDQPGLIPGRPSHGCIRVPNGRIARLARLLPIGTPLRIR